MMMANEDTPTTVGDAMRDMNELSEWADDMAQALVCDAFAQGMGAEEVLTAITLMYRRMVAAYPDERGLQMLLRRAEAAA